MKKFLRKGWFRYSKLGKKRKNKQVWKRPSGRDNKMREKRRGYPVVVSIGYRTSKSERGLIEGKNPVRIMNLKDLEKIGKGEIGLLGKVGKKKMLEIAKAAEDKKIKITNLNSRKVLRKESRKNKSKEIKNGSR